MVSEHDIHRIPKTAYTRTNLAGEGILFCGDMSLLVGIWLNLLGIKSKGRKRQAFDYREDFIPI
jgi:hypothetical protein